ncbi:coiled-coil domain-containing protein 103-like isoform X2 [Pomacea canaliculata]|uniref:coiled-coil domain-containing protein 103-like isoform X2 n=1 Tax=Pomacea canaliculata TaxID=400727 RepID=UPI000D735069|nr:coiled-coil domain-containing protein 103-like isoform X2 [Pomacea canaliculata]
MKNIGEKMTQRSGLLQHRRLLHIRSLNLVAACHLKPLEKGDDIERMISANQIWNSAIQNKSYPQISSKTAPAAVQVEMQSPKSGQDFARDWQHRYKTQEQRYAYLMFTGADHLAKIFKTEVSFGLLGDILAALTPFPEEDCETVINILSSIRGSSRFNLSLRFLNTKEKDTCSQLFQRLVKVVEHKGLVHLNMKLLSLQASFNS